MEFKSTKRDTVENLKMLILGPTGSGKTSLIRTLPVEEDRRVLVISSELGSEVLRKREFQTAELDQSDILGSLLEVLTALHQPDMKGDFDWIVLDSMTDIGEKYLAWCIKNPGEFMTKNNKVDMLAIYGDLKLKMLNICRNFLAVPDCHKLMIAGSVQNNDGPLSKISMSMDGRAKESLPFVFDEVYHIRVRAGNEPGEVIRELVTNQDGIYHDAKSRMSGPSENPLALYEEMDITFLINKCYEGKI